MIDMGHGMLRCLNGILFPHRRQIDSPISIGNREKFYERAIVMAQEQFERTEGRHSAVYFKIVPESHIMFSDGDFVGYNIKLKVFSSPREGFLNKIPDRMHKIKDMKKVIVYDESLCQTGLSVHDPSNYTPFEYAREFSSRCVLELSEKIRSRMAPYSARVIHPYNMARKPG